MSQHATPPHEQLHVEFARTIRVEERFDLAARLRALSAGSRAEYWAMDLDGAEEWERPIRWASLVILDSVFEGDVEEEDVFVLDRPRLRSQLWSEEAYDLLCGAVPWLVPTVPPTSEELARIPGPLDTPLPLTAAGASR